MNSKTTHENGLDERFSNNVLKGKISNVNLDGAYLNDDTENVIRIPDVPIYIKYNTISSVSTSTGPSTPNSREYEQIDVRRNCELNNDNTTIGMRSAIPSNTLRNNDVNNNWLIKGQTRSSYGLLDNSNFNLNFFNFKIIKKSHLNSNTLLKNNDRIFIEMTKPNDFSFLLNCNLNDGNDFLYLKSEQRLLVDFQEFPTMLVDLLNRSKSNFSNQNDTNQVMNSSFVNTGMIESENKVFPGISKQESSIANTRIYESSVKTANSLKIILNVNSTEILGGCDKNIGFGMSNIDSCILHFVELNHYKEIVHLSLQFETANELLFRNYILTHLNFYYELSKKQQIIINNNEYEISKLKNNLIEVEDRLKTSNYIFVKNERELSEKYEIDIRRLIDKYEFDYNQLKNNYESMYKNELKQWEIEKVSNENKINELQKQFNDLGNIFNNINNSKLELENLISHDQKIISELKAKLDDKKNSYDILLNLKVELETELNDLKLKYNNILDLNKNIKSEIEIKQKEINELDNALDDACKEINKGNHIITSLQNSLSNVDNKYKQQMVNYNNLKRNSQELEINYKNTIEKLKDCEQLLDDSNNRQDQLIDENERLRKTLIEAEKQIEINQNIISSLKKQLSVNEFDSTKSNYRNKVSYNDYYYNHYNRNLISSNGMHYTLNNNNGLSQSIASVSASRISVFNGASRGSLENKHKQISNDDVFDANSTSRKYSMTLNSYPRRSHTWSMENANHQSKENSLISKSTRNSSTGRVLRKSTKVSVHSSNNNISSSIFTPPNHKNTSRDVNANDLSSNKAVKIHDNDNDKWSNEQIQYNQADDYLYPLFNELECENIDNLSKELTTPRLKTPVKPVRSGSSYNIVINSNVDTSNSSDAVATS